MRCGIRLLVGQRPSRADYVRGLPTLPQQLRRARVVGRRISASGPRDQSSRTPSPRPKPVPFEGAWTEARFRRIRPWGQLIAYQRPPKSGHVGDIMLPSVPCRCHGDSVSQKPSRKVLYARQTPLDRWTTTPTPGAHEDPTGAPLLRHGRRIRRAPARLDLLRELARMERGLRSAGCR